MRKMMLCIAAMLFALSMPVHAEEPEMTTYSFDLSQFAGGDPDDYEYSFDKKNWTKERTWEVEVGKDYELYVKYPDGNVGLITFFKGGDISPMEENLGAGSETSESKETEPTESTEPDETKEKDEEDKAGNTEKGEGFLKVFFVALLIAVVVLFGGGFMFLRSRKSK